MNALPKVKEFIIQDSSNYGITVEYSGGKPRFLFYDKNDNMIELIFLAAYNRDEMKEILQKRGFKPVNEEL